MSLETYISEFSKYVISLIMILYTLFSFLVLLKKNEEKRKLLYTGQIVLMFAFHFCSFMVICFETGKFSYLIFYILQQIVLFLSINLYKSIYKNSNRLVVNNMCMFLSIGLVFLTRLEYNKAVKQFVIAAFSLALSLFIPFLIHRLKLIKNLKYIYAVAGVFLLGIVFILGNTTYGSKISYSILGVSFQPAEFVKILFVLFMASALYNSTEIKEILFVSIVAFLHVIIQVLNKDLGSALIFFVVYVLMVFVSSKNILYLIAGLLMGTVASMIAYKYFSHVRLRVEAFLDPWSAIDSSGYQITQSLFAISSGGSFGMGLYKGTPDSIPFVEDDFIFSAISEEFGIVFGACLILLCLSTFLMIMKVSRKNTMPFYSLMAFGLGVTYIFQVFLTIGGGTKFIPLTGVTLPFVSYGGSSMLTCVFSFAVIAGVSLFEGDLEIQREVQREPQRETQRKPHREQKREPYREFRKEQRPQYRDNTYEQYDEYAEYDEINAYDDYEEANESDDVEILDLDEIDIDNDDEFLDYSEIYYNEEEYEKENRQKHK